jgi:hypothetical protein
MRYGMTRRGVVTSLGIGVAAGFALGIVGTRGSILAGLVTAVIAAVGVLAVYVNARWAESAGILKGRKRTRDPTDHEG